MQFSNSDKSKHGNNFQDAVEGMLNYFYKKNYIKNFSKDYRIGKNGYSNTEQFYAAFKIEFESDDQWIIYTTTSLRTDRIKGQQWDSSNIKILNPAVKKAFLVYPDGIEEKISKDFERQHLKYINCEEYSAIDGVISTENLSIAIEREKYKNENAGKRKDAEGNTLEEIIAYLLNNEQNLRKWVSNDKLSEGLHYDAFKKIVDGLDLDKNNTAKILATSDKKFIGKLPTGGNPKTDVVVEIWPQNGDPFIRTISCKRTALKSVSVHEYSADSFADVLDNNNHNLRELLNKFQSAGNLRDMGEANRKLLTLALAPYAKKLALWVLGGYGGTGNPNTQIATHILTASPNSYCDSVLSVIDYYNKLTEQGIIGHFGTIFQWTYPSKKKGSKIQLKCRII